MSANPISMSDTASVLNSGIISVEIFYEAVENGADALIKGHAWRESPAEALSRVALILLFRLSRRRID